MLMNLLAFTFTLPRNGLSEFQLPSSQATCSKWLGSDLNPLTFDCMARTPPWPLNKWRNIKKVPYLQWCLWEVVGSLNEANVVFVEAEWSAHHAVKAKIIAEELQQWWRSPENMKKSSLHTFLLFG